MNIINPVETASAAAIKEKNPKNAFLIEFVGGIFGLLGLGYFYIGRTEEAILHLVIWICYNLFFWVGSYFLYVLSPIFLYICVPILLLSQVAIPYLSAIILRENILYLKS